MRLDPLYATDRPTPVSWASSRVFCAHVQVRKHYQGQYLRQVSPLDKLATTMSDASPSAFFGGVVTDIFYAPAQALVTSPGDLEGALLQSQDKVARSLGGGAAALGYLSRSLASSLRQGGDGAYDASSPMDMQSSVDTGLSFMRDPASSQFGGQAGRRETEPRADEEEGVGGLLAGLGLGKGFWSGTAGVLDLASRSSLGLASAVAGTMQTDPLEFAGRLRPPRPVSRDGLCCPNASRLPAALLLHRLAKVQCCP